MAIGNQLPPLPVDQAGLGLALMQFRSARRMTLAAVAHQVGRSTSSIQRYETGRQPVPLDVASALDVLYGTRGWITASVGHLGVARWLWHPRGTPRSRWLHRWDPSYEGQIWVTVVPQQGRALRRHTMTLTWGPWTIETTQQPPPDGIVLLSGKDEDQGPAPAVEVVVHPPAVVFFGIEEPPSSAAQVIDIRSWWRVRGDRRTGDRPPRDQLG